MEPNTKKTDAATEEAVANGAESTGATPEDPAASTEAATDRTSESFEAQLLAALAEKEENLRGWQRAQADFSNYRRRTEQEKAELIKSAEGRLIVDLLPVVDDLDRAITGLPAELRGLTWVEGILLIERKLRAVLELHGVTPIEALGQEFDPHQHEAVLRDGEAGEATTVVGELQKGYRLHDRVLRPSLVKVGPPPNIETRG
jgi:molecular chaperone GrpE